MMLKLTLQYFGHLMRRADSLEKTLMLGGTAKFFLCLYVVQCLVRIIHYIWLNKET